MGWAVDENGVMYDGVDVTNRVVSSVVIQHTTQSTTKQTLTKYRLHYRTTEWINN